MNKKFLALVTVVLVLLIAVVSFSLSEDSPPEDPFPISSDDPTRVVPDSDTNTDSTTSTSAPAPGTTPEDRPENVLTPLRGTQTGTVIIFEDEVVFPESILQVEESDLFSFTAAGLDLATLDNQNLQLNGEFPFLEITGAGGADITGEESVTFEITSLTPNFYLLNEEGLREEISTPAQEQLRQVLESAGIIIPEANELDPVSVPVIITKTGAGTVVQSIPETNLKLRFNLE